MIDCLLDLFYPPACEGCGTLLSERSRLLCLKCFQALPRTDFFKGQYNPVEQHFWGRLPIEKATAFLHFRKQGITQKLLHLLKYEQRADVGFNLGKWCAIELDQKGFFEGIELILPVPIHPKKAKKRGYNQSRKLAAGLAAQLKIEVAENHLIKASPTVSQTTKSRSARYQNVSDSFALRQANELTRKHLLLLDDVITTGSTLEACGRLLLDQTDCQLSILSLAATE